MASTNPTPSAGRGWEPAGGMFAGCFSWFSFLFLVRLGRAAFRYRPNGCASGRGFVPSSRGGATSAYASRSVPAEAEDATATEGRSRASTDAALPVRSAHRGLHAPRGKVNGTMTVHSGCARVMAIAFHGSVAPFCRGNAARPANFSWRAGTVRRFQVSSARPGHFDHVCRVHVRFVLTLRADIAFAPRERCDRKEPLRIRRQVLGLISSRSGSSARRNARAGAIIATSQNGS